LTATGDLLGIPVLDHIVVGDGRYFSFKERGQMQPADITS
jgi:DNA repair protein RadC